METLADRITTAPQVCGGQPTIRGTRMTIQTVLEYLAAGETTENILAAFPLLEEEDVRACLQFVASALTPRRYLPLAS